MKELKHYQCEICKTIYSDAFECRCCEEFHVTKLKIHSKQYLGYKNDKKEFPNSIILIDGHGKKVKYNRSNDV